MRNQAALVAVREVLIMGRVKMVCRDCGSDNIDRDAWVKWDTELQEWAVSQLLVRGYCYSCDQDTYIKESRDIIAT